MNRRPPTMISGGNAITVRPGRKLASVSEDLPWPPGSATGIGSMPGTDPAEAMRIVAGELPAFPYLPELPGRGPGADIIGRTSAMLVGMPAEVTPRGWRLAERPGRDSVRAASMLSSDLDLLEEVLQGYRGPVKIQVCGPWTLAAMLELTRTMEPALSDPGAVADIAASLAEGAAAHAADVAKRVPGGRVVVQFDEPALAAVAAGEVPTASGLSRLPAIEEDTLRERLATVIAGSPGYPVVHCCAAATPFGIIRRAGAGAVSFDLGQLRRGEEDGVGEAAEAGMGLLIGAVPAVPAVPGDDGLTVQAGGVQAARRVTRLWRALGLGSDVSQVVVTPACGLAGPVLTSTAPAWVRDTLARCREAAAILPEMIAETEGER
jgi:Cobalamin-independent synthase, Catalytic domain